METKQPTPPSIILCADDFGISDGVNGAILQLCAAKRLSAVSCMSGGPAFTAGAPVLKRIDGLAVGLHLTLTYLPPLASEIGARHPREIILGIKSWLRLLDRAVIEKELKAQFDRFRDVMGRAPDFIDGHQHVHVLPVVRDIVLKLRETYAPKSWVRNVADETGFKEGGLKQRELFIMGYRFRQMLEEKGIPHNKRFRGAYKGDFGAAMENWCAAPEEGRETTLVYCHPGYPDAELAQFDTLLAPRRFEFEFLNGEAFGAWPGARVALAGKP